MADRLDIPHYQISRELFDRTELTLPSSILRFPGDKSLDGRIQLPPVEPVLPYLRALPLLQLIDLIPTKTLPNKKTTGSLRQSRYVDFGWTSGMSLALGEDGIARPVLKPHTLDDLVKTLFLTLSLCIKILSPSSFAFPPR